MKLLSHTECRAGGCVGGCTALHNTGDGTKSVTADAEEERSRLQLRSPAAVRGLLLPDPYLPALQLSAYVPPPGAVLWGPLGLTAAPVQSRAQRGWSWSSCS